MFKSLATARKWIEDYPLQAVLFFGILFRVFIFIFQGPFNNDSHFEVVRYIYDSHLIPISNQFGLSFHPPLYYVLASFFLIFSVKGVQFFSLLLSIINLIVLYWLIIKSEFIKPLRVKKYCLLLTCLLPQLIMFSNYISNDALSFFIGSLIFLQLYFYVESPKISRLITLAILLGAGLLTKGSFLFFIPALIISLTGIGIIYKFSFKKSAAWLFIFVVIFSCLGSYKFIENIRHFHRPIVHNLDLDTQWSREQRPALRKPAEFFLDFNLIKLFKHPVVSDMTLHSLPMLLYGTFWYQYIPESNFQGNLTKFKYLGSSIYILALLPSFLCFVGFLKLLALTRSALFGKKNNNLHPKLAYYQIACFLMLLANLLGVVLVGLRYNVWSCFQSRLLFPSFFVIVMLFASGLSYVEYNNEALKNTVYALLNILFILFIGYFIIEIALKFIPGLAAL